MLTGDPGNRTYQNEALFGVPAFTVLFHGVDVSKHYSLAAVLRVKVYKFVHLFEKITFMEDSAEGAPNGLIIVQLYHNIFYCFTTFYKLGLFLI